MLDALVEENKEDKVKKDHDLEAILAEIRSAITKEDEGASLALSLQKNRQLLLDYATNAYIRAPHRVGILEGVLGLLAQMEGSLRNDRKEKAKKEEAENNGINFAQMMEAMEKISNGSVRIPTFNMSNFILDPNKSLLEAVDNPETITPINDEELKQGIQLVDVDGNPIGYED